MKTIFLLSLIINYHRQSYFCIVFSSDLSAYLPAAEKTGRVLCGKSDRILESTGRNGGIVRGAKEIGQVEKGVVYFEFTAHRRLDPPGVDPRAEPGILSQMPVEGLFIYYRAAGHVDQDGVRLT